MALFALKTWPIRNIPSYPHQIPFVQQQKQKLQKKMPTDLTNLLMAYTVGDKIDLSTRIKKSHKALNLLHLFTPSGIHFSSLSFLFFPLIFFLGKINPYLSGLLYFGLYFLSFFFPGFYSIKRIILIKALHLWPKKIDIFKIFVYAFVFDFFVGTFRFSPMSYVYSFLFLGIIFNMKNFPKIYFIYFIFIAQLIICFFQNDTLYIIAPLFGILLTLLFSLFFPLYLCGLFLTDFIPVMIYKYALNFFLTLVFFMSRYVGILGAITPTLPFIILFLLLFFNFNKRYKYFIIICLMLTHSSTIYNLPRNSLRGRIYNGAKNKKLENFIIDKIKLKGRHFHIIYTNGIRCKLTLYNNYYRDECR